MTWALIYAQLGSNNIIYCATWVAVEMVWSKRILRSKMSDKEKSNSQGDYTVNNVIIYHYCLGSIHLITFIEMIIYYVHAEFWTLSFKWKFMSSSLNYTVCFCYVWGNFLCQPWFRSVGVKNFAAMFIFYIVFFDRNSMLPGWTHS